MGFIFNVLKMEKVDTSEALIEQVVLSVGVWIIWNLL